MLAPMSALHGYGLGANLGPFCAEITDFQHRGCPTLWLFSEFQLMSCSDPAVFETRCMSKIVIQQPIASRKQLNS